MSAAFADPYDNKIVYRRLKQDGRVCTWISGPQYKVKTCEDPAKYMIYTNLEGQEEKHKVCADHARDLLAYMIGRL